LSDFGIALVHQVTQHHRSPQALWQPVQFLVGLLVGENFAQHFENSNLRRSRAPSGESDNSRRERMLASVFSIVLMDLTAL
jgi:hypothetical protein